MVDDKTVYYKERSYQACISAGWMALFDRYKAVLRFAWAPALLAAVGFALVFYLVFVHYLWITPGALAVVGALLVVYAVAAACWRSSVRVQVAFFRATGDLPSVSAYNFLHNIRRLLPKSLAEVAFFVVCWSAVGAVVFAALAVSGWWWPALLPLGVLIVFGNLLIQFWTAEECTFRDAWQLAVHEGVRCLGSWSLVRFTGCTAACLTSFFFLLPAAILSYSYFISKVAMINGDPSGMPSGAAWLYFAACIVGAFGMHLSSLLVLWPGSLMAASIVCKHRSAEKRREELTQLEKEQEALRR